ncbi:MAG: mandelate racemase/muconate lactonizing enzyme family protein [Bryobacterales bacterium]|nr:mandelate racemase/muconate lactonizing enzyme family protein [Bryobacterales bacterium]
MLHNESAPKIRITEVRVHQLTGKLKERFGWSQNWTHERHATLVEVVTDAGLTGWGDGGYGGDWLVENPGLVIGRSPFEVEAIHEELRAPGGFQQRPRAQTHGGLDIALWDLVGQALDVPVSALMGRRYRDRVQPYCTALYRKDWRDLAAGLAEEAKAWRAAGFRVIKMKTGYGPEVDVEIVFAVRNALGAETGLAIDSNCAYDAGTAAMIGKRLEPFHLLWWEEPVLASDYEGYRRLRNSFSIPLAAGEYLPADLLAERFIQPRLVDILQPDIETVGMTGARRLTWLTWLNHMRLIPHNWGSAVRTAAELQWAATIPPIAEGLCSPPVMFEFDLTENPFREAVVREKLEMGTDGSIPVPDGPGLGIHVVREAVEEFRKNLIVIC